MGAQSQQGEGFQVYNATLPAGDDLVLQARGLGIVASPAQNSFGAPNAPSPNAPAPNAPSPNAPGSAATATPSPTPRRRAAPKNSVAFEVLDARSGQWRALDGAMKRDDSPAGGWNFRARIDPALSRPSDRLLRVRARLNNARASVSSFNIVRR